MKKQTKILGLVALTLALLGAGVWKYSTTNLQGASTSIPGICGPSDAYAPSCAQGGYSGLPSETASDGSITQHWKCIGFAGGSTATCTKQAPKINGECGTYHGIIADSLGGLMTGRCIKGLYSSLPTETSGDGLVTWKWQCAGRQGGATVACNAFKAGTTIDGACGAEAGSCGAGTAGEITVTAGVFNDASTWSCAGHGGSNASCSASGPSSSPSLICRRAGEGVGSFRDFMKSDLVQPGEEDMADVNYEPLISHLQTIMAADTLKEGVEKDPMETCSILLMAEMLTNERIARTDVTSVNQYVTTLYEGFSGDVLSSTVEDFAQAMFSQNIDPEEAREEAISEIGQIQEAVKLSGALTDEQKNLTIQALKSLSASFWAEYYNDVEDFRQFVLEACSGGINNEEATQKALDLLEENGISSSSSDWKADIQEAIDVLSK